MAANLNPQKMQIKKEKTHGWLADKIMRCMIEMIVTFSKLDELKPGAYWRNSKVYQNFHMNEWLSIHDDYDTWFYVLLLKSQHFKESYWH